MDSSEFQGLPVTGLGHLLVVKDGEDGHSELEHPLGHEELAVPASGHVLHQLEGFLGALLQLVVSQCLQGDHTVVEVLHLYTQTYEDMAHDSTYIT